MQSPALLRIADVDAATFAPFAQQIAARWPGGCPGMPSRSTGIAFPTEVSALEPDARAMDHLIAEVEHVGVNIELSKLIKVMAERAIAAGHGTESYPVLVEVFAKP